MNPHHHRQPTFLQSGTLLASFFVVLSCAAQANADYPDTVGPLLQKHCAACHGPEKQEGDVRFEVIVDGDSRFLSEVVHRLKDGQEPPRIPPINIAGAKRLTLKVHYVDDFVRDFANWLEPMLIK